MEEVSIRPLLDQLAFTRDRFNWGYQLRFELFGIEEEDADLIVQAMCRTNPETRDRKQVQGLNNP